MNIYIYDFSEKYKVKFFIFNMIISMGHFYYRDIVENISN